MPIYDYFGERQEAAEKRNQEYMTKSIERARQRMLDIERESRLVYRPRAKEDLTDDQLLSILNLHIAGYGNGWIAELFSIGDDLVYRALQLPLLRWLCGARNSELFMANKKHRLTPKTEAIRNELQDLGMTFEEWRDSMRKMYGLKTHVMNVLHGNREGTVTIGVALMVTEYFGGNADEYFAKEKAAE